MFCCVLLYAHSSFAIILMGKRELVALLSLSSWCLFLPVPWVCLQFVIVVFLIILTIFVNLAWENPEENFVITHLKCHHLCIRMNQIAANHMCM